MQTLSEQFAKPKPIDDVTVVFPAKVLDRMPPYEEIPDEFKSPNKPTKWNRVQSRWFFQGLPEGTEFHRKKGVDKTLALKNLQAIQASFEPKHEHKEAAVAYLMSLWFDDVTIPE